MKRTRARTWEENVREPVRTVSPPQLTGLVGAYAGSAHPTHEVEVFEAGIQKVQSEDQEYQVGDGGDGPMQRHGLDPFAMSTEKQEHRLRRHQGGSSELRATDLNGGTVVQNDDLDLDGLDEERQHREDGDVDGDNGVDEDANPGSREMQSGVHKGDEAESHEKMTSTGLPFRPKK